MQRKIKCCQENRSLPRPPGKGVPPSPERVTAHTASKKNLSLCLLGGLGELGVATSRPHSPALLLCLKLFPDQDGCAHGERGLPDGLGRYGPWSTQGPGRRKGGHLPLGEPGGGPRWLSLGPWARESLPQGRQDGAAGPTGSGTRVHEDHMWGPEGRDGWALERSAPGGRPMASPSLAPIISLFTRRKACGPDDLTCCLKTNKRLPCQSVFGLECYCSSFISSL